MTEKFFAFKQQAEKNSAICWQVKTIHKHSKTMYRTTFVRFLYSFPYLLYGFDGQKKFFAFKAQSEKNALCW